MIRELRLGAPLVLAAILLLALGMVFNASAETPSFNAPSSSMADGPITPTLLLPLVQYNYRSPSLAFSHSWATGLDHLPRQVFLPQDVVYLWFDSFNTFPEPKDAELTWLLESSCAPPQVITDTVRLYPGYWTHNFAQHTPPCLGTYTSALEITSGNYSAVLTTRFVANPLSANILEDRQAFDRCLLPSVEQMDVWWHHSPYWTFNVYLGGISFFCWQNPLDAFWISAVAEQGWSFILTWVGPQAPCSRYKHPMSADPVLAYQQGRNEADLAVARAEELGFLGAKTIYYDMESYSGATTSCRIAVDAFMTGWVERLHELGVQAGGYGSACSSYISDWADNSPAPDSVWIAHWYEDTYSPDASVWETPCLGDIPGPPRYWIDHQRLKQYAGDHVETWGGLALTIDSNVMDGPVTALSMTQPASLSDGALQLQTGPQIQAFDLLDRENGWLIQGGQLYWTRDQGTSWSRLRPEPDSGWEILAADFVDPQQGWLAARPVGTAPWQPFTLFRTSDAGQTWQALPFTLAEPEYTGLQIEFSDSHSGWLFVQQPSGSSFSRARLFATRDAGLSWQEYAPPTAGQIYFTDDQQGWLSGGPDGRQAYRTQDGGQTWQPVDQLPTAAKGALLAGDLPGGTIASTSINGQSGWALVQEGSCRGDKTRLEASTWQCWLETSLWQTGDAGQTWSRVGTPGEP